MRLLLTTALLTATLGLAACGGDDKAKTPPKATPAVARAQAKQTRTALAAAIALYKKGDKTGADNALAEAYVNHFEIVEPPLADVDKAFMQQVEAGLSIKIRMAVRSGTPAEVDAQYKQLDGDLAKAETMLK